MRTTVDLDDDTAAEVHRLRTEEQRGLSEAVNELIRRGMMPRRHAEPFVQITHHLGSKIDISNIGETLDLLEGPEHR